MIVQQLDCDGFVSFPGREGEPSGRWNKVTTGSCGCARFNPVDELAQIRGAPVNRAGNVKLAFTAHFYNYIGRALERDQRTVISSRNEGKAIFVIADL